MERGFIFAVILLLNISSLISASVRSSYGEKCNKTLKCDRRAWLSCINNTCSCTKSDEMLFDKEKGKCLTKSGERCKYGLENEENSLVEIIECTLNATCNSDGICVCDTHYHEISSGLCKLSNSFGENCTEANECSLFEGLTCIEGICKCNVNVTALSKPITNQCAGLLGHPCIGMYCVDGAICDSGQCVCNGSFYLNHSTNTCDPRKKIFQNCTKSDECIQMPNLNLSCVDGVCSCNKETHAYDVVQKFEQKSGMYVGPAVEICAPIVGQPCQNGYCVSGAYCLRYYDGTYKSICKCRNGLSANRKKTTCGGIYGYGCSKSADCLDDLKCSGQHCECPFPNHQTFDRGQRSCITIVGGHCTKESTCVPNAFCNITLHSTKSGHCECSKGFVEIERGECKKAFGQSCFSSSECDSIASLICVDGVCACNDEMYRYSSSHRSCLGSVGARCNEKGMGEIVSCLENAECFQLNPKLKAKCRCKWPNVENLLDYTCQEITG